MVKLIDLTHSIDPSHVQRKFSVETIGAETVNHNVIRKDKQWYIMSNIAMVSHIGTHIEVPYHLFPNGYDLSNMPIDTYYGNGVLLNFSEIQQRIEISVEQVKIAADKVGGIRQGDIVLCNLGYANRYGQKSYSESPYFSTNAIKWLIDSGMKMMGVDAGGIELPLSEEHVNHAALFANNIPLIENVANLNLLPPNGFHVSAFPYPIHGVEAFPVRVVALLDTQ